MKNKKLISVVGPLYNEEDLIEAYCNEMLHVFEAKGEQYDLELILVDDGSMDNTMSKAIEIQKGNPDRVTIVQLTRNFGLEGAIYAGMSVAQGDAVVVMDADLQDPPSVVIEMLAKWEDGADIVVASRAGRPNDGVFKRWSAGLFYKILDSLSGKLKLEPSAANFRLLGRNAVEKYLELPEVNGVFRVLVPFLGMKTAVVTYDRDKRYAGETKYNLSSMIRYALDSITGISIEPLRKVYICTSLSFILLLFSIFFTMLVEGEYIHIGIISILVSSLFTLLFIVLSIIAEYLGQVYTEVKQRPLSLIYKTIRSESAKRRS